MKTQRGLYIGLKKVDQLKHLRTVKTVVHHISGWQKCEWARNAEHKLEFWKALINFVEASILYRLIHDRILVIIIAVVTTSYGGRDRLVNNTRQQLVMTFQKVEITQVSVQEAECT